MVRERIGNGTFHSPEGGAGGKNIDFKRRTDTDIKAEIQKNNWKLESFTTEKLHLLGRRRQESNGSGRNGNEEMTPETFDTQALSHLADTHEIMQLVPEDIKLAALVHDIGKSGPAEMDSDHKDKPIHKINEARMQKFIIAMFAHPFKIPQGETGSMTVQDLVDDMFLDKSDLDEEGDPKEKRNYQLIKTDITKKSALRLLKNIGVEPTDNVLTGFFEKHVEWGESTLDKEAGISDRIKYIALNHHNFLKDIHVDIEEFEPTEEDNKQTFFLEVVDYYQARRRRGNTDHITAGKGTRERFEQRIEEKIERGDDFDPEQIREWLTYIFDNEIAAKQEDVFNKK